jgi:uncharacterized protein with FMN-binding domain
MKKFFLSASLAVLYVFYLVFEKQSMASPLVIAPPAISQSASQSLAPALNNTQAPIAQSPPNPKPTNAAPKPSGATAQPSAPPRQNNGQYKDGTYTGQNADAYYGIVRVRALVQNGKLVDVTFLNYPQDRRNSQYINSQAMPYLKQEALIAQSANVDIISGATDTSQAFIQSLASALQQAKI